MNLNCGLLTALIITAPAVASAHVEVKSGSVQAGDETVVTFGIEHGCTGVDTSSLSIDIPAVVTEVRPENSLLGKATTTRDASLAVTGVSWAKPDSELLATDDNYYTVKLYITVPDAAFTIINFPAHQVCKTQGGVSTTVDWTDPSEDDTHPLPALVVLPAHTAGWNKMTVPNDIPDLSVFFSDAQIVWKGTAAYSANADVAAAITATDGASALTSLSAGDTVWVKY